MRIPSPVLLHFDLDFLRERFCFSREAGLRADSGRNLDVAAGSREPDVPNL